MDTTVQVAARQFMSDLFSLEPLECTCVDACCGIVTG